ncbi:hypothetical protein PARMER_04185 [Parabacteroides merdae ATCC 43184]|nr:hypothetical protein PARMER_04185 [Parabacteroides merdae ATCC 43184]
MGYYHGYAFPIFIRLRRLSIEDLRKIEYMYQYQRY